MGRFDDLLRQKRWQACRRLGTSSPVCSAPGCVETDPIKLTGIYPTILCYEHQRVRDGLAIAEDHHVAGKRYDGFTVQLPGNDHLVLTAMSQSKGPRRCGVMDTLSRARARLGGRRKMLIQSIEWDEDTCAILDALDEYRETPAGGAMWKDFCDWWSARPRDDGE